MANAINPARLRIGGAALVFLLSLTVYNAELITRGINDGSFRFTADDVVTIKVVPVYVHMLVNRGKYLEAYGRPAEAVEVYQRALSLDPDSAAAQESLSKVRQKRSGSD